MVRYFISHSSVNKNIADEFVDLLVMGGSVSQDDIFCSSSYGYGINPGDNFVDTIKDKLDNSTVVFALVSPNYLDRSFCWAELGASWIQSKKVVPVLFPKVKYPDLTSIFQNIQSVKIDNERDIDSLTSYFSSNTGFKVRRWNDKVEKFIKNIKDKLENEPAPEKVSYSRYKDMKKRYNEKCIELQNLTSENKKNQDVIEKLKEIKDKKEVQTILSENDSAYQKFEQLCDEISDALEQLPKIMAIVCFRDHIGEVLSYQEANNYDLRQAFDCQYVIDEGNYITLNRDNIKVKKILKLLKKLNDFMYSDKATDICDDVEQNKEISFDLNNKEFWEHFFDVRW